MPCARVALPALALAFAAAAGCEPIWWVRSAARAEAETKVTPKCIEAALRANGVAKPEAFPLISGGGVGYTIKQEGQEITLMWNAEQPRAFTVMAKGIGSFADRATVARVREARTDLLRHLSESCGPFEAYLGETCERADCAP